MIRRAAQSLREMPPTIRNGLVSLSLAGVGLCVLQVTAFVAIQANRMSFGYAVAAILLGLLWFPLAGFHGRRRTKLFNALKQYDGHLCPRCEHPLSDPDNIGERTCSECAMRVSDEHNARFWKKWRDL